ncbi:hypothetical protein ACT17_14680 [Mycolicibacterium conceptionense]|uniref:Uncharacterized protein n=1 Tax=Mycolicibacterium conceptionense TaxID=451644 RepID=A0A0J8UAW5_9MYCO|nr:hypothetical protein ACT17_14680 [Mycolicibacterium conceptionense]
MSERALIGHCAAGDLRIGDRFRRCDTGEDPVVVTRVFTPPGAPTVEVAGEQNGEKVRFITSSRTVVELI